MMVVEITDAVEDPLDQGRHSVSRQKDTLPTITSSNRPTSSNRTKFISNVTQPFMPWTKNNNNSTSPLTSLFPDVQVYLRSPPSGSTTITTPNKLQPYWIVAIRPKVDIAILHLPPPTIIEEDAVQVPTIPYRSSESLLVGQSVIGNPFCLT